MCTKGVDIRSREILTANKEGNVKKEGKKLKRRTEMRSHSSVRDRNKPKFEGKCAREREKEKRREIAL